MIQLYTTRVNVIYLILCDLGPDVIWEGVYPHGFKCLFR